MKLFLDANILVAVLNKEMPLFTFAARVISLPSHNKKYTIYITPICLAIAFYFAEKKTSTKKALEKISLLSENIHIISVGNEQVVSVRNNPKISDFEDGLQYYTAKDAGCEAIITETLNDFHFSDITVFDCKTFMLEIYA